MTKDEATLGVRVRSARGFSGVPAGTEGVIDQFYNGGVMVAWDRPASPRGLPAGYRAYDGVPALRSGILRDGFADDELDMLEVVG